MTSAIRQTVKVKAGGRIEFCAPELEPGTLAEVIVLVESGQVREQHGQRARELVDLLRVTQALPAARGVTEDEIAAEIEAYRSSCR